MAPARFRFDRFSLDAAERRLWAGAEPVDLTARYLDALILLVREAGSLVTKERFLEEVWGGIPVTDEALTQCIRTLRRQLGDSATNPRLIETVPKHGYRFIGRVEQDEAERETPAPPAQDQEPPSWHQWLLFGGAGAIGGGIAGVIGGIFLGFAAAAQSPHEGLGAFSVLFVLLGVNVPIGMIGGAGVGLGIGVAGGADRSCPRTVLGGACGGLVVGAIVKLLGTDVFRLLFGHAPGDMTGAHEGLLLGAAVGVGLCLTLGNNRRPRIGLMAAAAVAGLVGMLIPATGGRLMAGSLAQLAEVFPNSTLHLELVSGAGVSGQIGRIAEAGLEGALFGVCMVSALLSARRYRG